MSDSTLVDTGPLVSVFNTRDSHHQWALSFFKNLKPPLYTCDAVITEVLYLLQGDVRSVDYMFGLMERKTLISDFSAQSHALSVKKIMKKYADTPMDFADACLVRMSELRPDAHIWTLDSGFLVYRRNGRANIPLVYPS